MIFIFGLSRVFTVYINLVMLAIGLYMVFVQRRDLVRISELKKEGTILKVVGGFYIVLSIAGFIILFTS